MRVVVIGTSNAILKDGYFYGLSDHRSVAAASNFSIGASTSVSLPMWMKRADFSDFDFVILDFALNEEVWARAGATTPRQIEDCVLGFIGSLGADGPTPVIAVLPSLTAHGDAMPIRDLYRRIAEDFGYPLFDGYEFLASLGHRLAIEPDGAFMDADHMLRHVGYAFGRTIAGALSALRPARQRMAPAAVDMGRYRYVEAREFALAEAEIVPRRTSLLAAEAVRLRGESVMSVALDAEAEVVGIGLNLAQSNARLEIASDRHTSVYKPNPKHFSGDGARLVYSILPLKALPGRDFRLRIAPGQPDSAAAEVIGLTIRDGRERGAVARYRPV
jgi:hypothetical protein